jgi:acyl-CoA hydrolase
MTTQAPNLFYRQLASNEQIDQTVKALKEKNIQAVVVNTGEEACEYVLKLLPEGAEVHSSMSRTLEQIGLTAIIEGSGRYQAIRPQLRKLDRVKQNLEFRKMGSSPDFMLGSVQAVTLDGQVIVGSGGGSQIGPYASGAGKVIWVVGAQKLVPTLEDGLRRLHEYSYPLEDERMQTAVGRSAQLNQILIIQGTLQPGRLTMVIVKENLGF